MRMLTAVATALLITGCSTPLRVNRLPHDAAAGLPGLSPYPSLKRQIEALLPDSLFPPSNVAIIIASLTTGETLYDLNSNLTFTPASNQKLFTSATALHELGSGYQFRTRVLVDSASPSWLYIRGSGDPILSTADLDSLSASLSRALPPGRIWTLAGDISRFDDHAKGLGWTWDDEPDPTVMFISPLSLNGNAIRVTVRPGTKTGDPARVSIDPPTGFVSFESTAITNAGILHHSITISRNWREHSNTITVSGEIRPADSPVSEVLSIADPDWYTLTVFRERLEACGVLSSGILLDTVPRSAVEIGHVSHGLDSVLTWMNTESDNLSAENILKTMAAERFGEPGHAEGGAAIMKQFLSTLEIDTSRIVVADGSGVSRYNLTSARAIAQLLVGMTRSSGLFTPWYNTLPVAGRSGTISKRMKGTAAEGNMRAKSGTLQGVSSLSGYVTTGDGERLAFSVLMQQYPSGSRRYREVQDRIGAFLASLRRSQF